MFLITCYKKDCPTPHFYVNPKGGRIPLIGGAKSPDLTQDLSNKFTSNLVSSPERKDEVFTKEQIDRIKEIFIEMQKQMAQDNSGKTIVEEKPEILDYLVMQCESNHKNYIPLIEKKKEDDKDEVNDEK